MVDGCAVDGRGDLEELLQSPDVGSATMELSKHHAHPPYRTYVTAHMKLSEYHAHTASESCKAGLHAVPADPIMQHFALRQHNDARRPDLRGMLWLWQDSIAWTPSACGQIAVRFPVKEVVSYQRRYSCMCARLSQGTHA